jgi:metal-responsive CopG/Arc/MetJ family transcriptional regulator
MIEENDLSLTKEKEECSLSIKLDTVLMKNIDELKNQWGLETRSEAIERLLMMVLCSEPWEQEP